MINAQPFFEGIKDVNEESISSVKALAETILILTAQNILEGLTSLFTGGTSLEEFGRQISNFAPYYKQYADVVKDVDGKVVSDSAIAAQSLAELSKNLPNQGGLVAWFTGDNTLDVWGSYLPEFGKHLKKYSDNVKGLDSNIVENSANSAKSLAEFAKSLPNQGGIVSWFTGDNTIDEFGKPLPDFGRNLKLYADNISGMDSNVISNSANSAKALSEFAKGLPNQGGIVSWFTGDNKISKFGEELAKFGKEFKNYYEQIKEISIDKINSITSVITNLTNQLIIIKNSNLGNTAKDYGSNIKDMCKQLKEALKNDINVNYWDYYNMGKNVGQGLIDGMNSKSWSVCETARQIGRDIVKKFKQQMDIRSPSHVMKKLAKFIPLGIAEGIDSESKAVYKSMANLADGIIVNPQDFSIDTNQFIDYGTIAGNINTQTKIEMRDLPQEVKQAVIEGMGSVSIPVEIEARADEGVIFTKMQAKAREFVMQTGEEPFPSPA